MIKITQVKSQNGRLASHKATLQCLGLKKVHQTVIIDPNASVMGMIKKISYMLKVEEVV